MMNKEFLTVRQFVANNHNSDKLKRTCIKCGEPATKEALFAVGNGVSLVERYCDACVKAVENRGPA